MLAILAALFISTLWRRSGGRSEAALPVSSTIPTAAVSQAQWSQEDEKTMDFSFIYPPPLHSPEQED